MYYSCVDATIVQTADKQCFCDVSCIYRGASAACHRQKDDMMVVKKKLSTTLYLARTQSSKHSYITRQEVTLISSVSSTQKAFSLIVQSSVRCLMEPIMQHKGFAYLFFPLITPHPYCWWSQQGLSTSPTDVTSPTKARASDQTREFALMTKFPALQHNMSLTHLIIFVDTEGSEEGQSVRTGRPLWLSV